MCFLQWRLFSFLRPGSEGIPFLISCSSLNSSCECLVKSIENSLGIGVTPLESKLPRIFILS